MQVIFSKIELETPPFLTANSSIVMSTKNVLARSHKKFQRGQHPEIYLLTLKKQEKAKMELSLDIVSKHAFCYLYLPDYLDLLRF